MKRVRADEQKEREAYNMPYVVQLTPNLSFGPAPRNNLDTFFLRKQTFLVNLVPNDKAYYMNHYDADEDEPRPTLYREAAFPLESLLEMSERRQLDVFVGRARRLEKLLKEHENSSIYIHYRNGDREEALLAFLVWYLLDPKECPRDLTAWLTEKDQRQVLRDDVDVEFFTKLTQEARRTSKSNALTAWVKKK